MIKDVWGIYYHKGSTDQNPQHHKCDESWCKYHLAMKDQKPYLHKNHLDSAVIKVIKPIFHSLLQPALLQKCLHGRTQNVNESLNPVV